MEKVQKISKTFECKLCDYTCSKLSEWTKHTLTRKHLGIEHNGSEKSQKFTCEKCNVTCFKLSKWNRHILTNKHLNGDKRSENIQTEFACKKCNKKYKSRSSVWYHETKCNAIETPYTGIIERLLIDNVELRKLIVDQTKTTSETMNKTIETIMIQNAETIETIMIRNTETIGKALECCKPISNTVNNNQTNKFNINVFLNEQCKDAINFADFVKNIEISREDLENNAQLGFVSGISKIFLDNLKQLGVNERPFHCTDTKRETMYIKDEDKWTKEADDSKLQKAIQTVSYRSIGKLQEWKQENPEYQDVNSEFSEKCLDMQRNTIAGSNREVYYPKVIHVLARETMVDK
jgi:hypothetical protein